MGPELWGRRWAVRAISRRRVRLGGSSSRPALPDSHGAFDPEPSWDALSNVVFTACGTTFSWNAVRESMVDDGTWATLERRAVQNAVAASVGFGSPSREALRSAAQQFRFPRGLGAAEDLRCWLKRWGISEGEWLKWLDHSQRAGYESVTAPEPPYDERASWVEAVCSGELESASLRLASAVACWAESSNGSLPPERERWATLRAAHSEMVQRRSERIELERIVDTQANSWMEVDLEWADFASPDAAREAVCCCRQDGDTLATVSARAGAPHKRDAIRAELLPGRHRSAAVSGPLGMPVVVTSSSEMTTTLVVWERRPPSLENPRIEALAAELCATSAGPGRTRSLGEMGWLSNWGSRSSIPQMSNSWRTFRWKCRSW